MLVYCYLKNCKKALGHLRKSIDKHDNAISPAVITDIIQVKDKGMSHVLNVECWAGDDPVCTQVT